MAGRGNPAAMRWPALAAALAVGVALIAGTGARAEGCGTPEGVCTVPGGTYRLALPEVEGGAAPALLFLHGWGGKSEGIMRNAAMRQTLAERGFALIAPDGQPREITIRGVTRKGLNWSVRDGRDYARDDAAFLAGVIEDAGRRGVDTGRILLAGFSRGGSMVWDIACRTPGMARAYAPVAGAFWEPLPEACAGPIDLFHTHGWADRTVPIEGRPLRPGITQGDAFASLAILRAAGGCAARQPDESAVTGVEGADGARAPRGFASSGTGPAARPARDRT